MKTALIIGSEGQDGKLLSMNLIAKNYHVIGVGRSANTDKRKMDYYQFDLSEDNFQPIIDIITTHSIDELYYLAAFHQSSEEEQLLNFHSIDKNFKVNLTAFIKVLEILKEYCSSTKVFYASSSLIFSCSGSSVQDEQTAHKPNCLYSVAKSAAMQIARIYRDNFGLFVSTGILYNHESIYRKDYFLSKKIINDTHRLQKGEIEDIIVGDLTAVTDWGYARDYVEAMHRILNQPIPEDYIIASNTSHTVKDWFTTLFGYLKKDWNAFVKQDPSLIRRKKPILIGNNSKLLKIGWKPSVTFEEMVIKMYKNQI